MKYSFYYPSISERWWDGGGLYPIRFRVDSPSYSPTLCIFGNLSTKKVKKKNCRYLFFMICSHWSGFPIPPRLKFMDEKSAWCFENSITGRGCDLFLEISLLLFLSLYFQAGGNKNKEAFDVVKKKISNLNFSGCTKKKNQKYISRESFCGDILFKKCALAH